MNRRVGFTLIELLVVIAIIALLLAILMPSLAKVKEIAAGVVCMNNQKNLALAYRMYADANDGKVTTQPFGDDDGWVGPIQDDMGNGVSSGNATLGDRINAIEAGVLFPYLEDPKVYHCMGDKRWLKGSEAEGDDPQQLVYVSYALPDDMLGGRNIKYSDVLQPANAFLFLEDGYDGRVSSNKGWSFKYDQPNPGTWEWHDPMGAYHTDGCTFSFFDGHTEKYKWRDDRSPKYFRNRRDPDVDRVQPNNQDIAYMISIYPMVD